MKVINFFAQVFAIFAFLTVGSLMMIIAFHILSYPDAVEQLQELYEPFHSMQAGILGLIFIAVGLIFTRMLLKQRRAQEALIYQSDIGPVVVSVTALEDVVKKVLKRYHLVKDWKIKTLIHGKEVEIKLRLVLWSGARLQALLTEIQEDLQSRIGKLLGSGNTLEILCDVQKIEDHEAQFPDVKPNQKQQAVSI